MTSDLSLDFLRVVEQAAIACGQTMGQGDRHKSDQVAVEAMRRMMDTVPHRLESADCESHESHVEYPAVPVSGTTLPGI
jgi:hypothetical protein